MDRFFARFSNQNFLVYLISDDYYLQELGKLISPLRKDIRSFEPLRECAFINVCKARRIPIELLNCVREFRAMLWV